MKQVRFAGSGYAAEDVQITIPAGSQLTHIRICPGSYNEPDVGDRLGTWFQINNSAPIMLRCLTILCADAFGFCCDIDNQLKPGCDRDSQRFPGDTQFEILIGRNARPPNIDEESFMAGAPPEDWLVVYFGGP